MVWINQIPQRLPRVQCNDCMTGPVNPFMPTVPTFAVRETDVSRHNGGTSGAPLKPLRDDSVRLSRCPHYAERRSLSDSKCWNLVAETQRWVKMG